MFAKHALHHPWLVGGTDDLESKLFSDAKELRWLWFAHAHLCGRKQRTQFPGKLYRRLLHDRHLLVTKDDAHQPPKRRKRHLLTRLQFELGKARVIVMLGELDGWVAAVQCLHHHAPGAIAALASSAKPLATLGTPLRISAIRRSV